MVPLHTLSRLAVNNSHKGLQPSVVYKKSCISSLTLFAIVISYVLICTPLRSKLPARECIAWTYCAKL